jgi:predicted nucleotidyltransferase
MKRFELFRTNIGSHIWKMNHEGSDIDVAVVYLMSSRELLLGKTVKGKQTVSMEFDYTYNELGNVIGHLLKGNCNYLWMVMAPLIISEYRSALSELKQIVVTNLAKNCYHSINGLSTHNLKHFIEQGDKKSPMYKKKLNIIGRTLKFGINLLTWNKFIFEPYNYDGPKPEYELWHLKSKLQDAYKDSNLPEKPNTEPFEEYSLKWRIYKLKKDGYI